MSKSKSPRLKKEVFFEVDISDFNMIKQRAELERLSLAGLCRNVVMREVLKTSS